MGWNAAREKAKKDLEDAKLNGLDRIIWDIEVDAKTKVPPGTTVRDYIADSIWEGIFYEDDDNIYVSLDSTALEFSGVTGNIDTVQEKVTFFPGVSGVVEVRYNHLDMEYLGNIDPLNVPKNNRAKRPYKTNITIT